MIEPGAYLTDFGKSAVRAVGMQERGSPEATAAAVLKIVDAEQPRLRLILGSTSLPQVRAVYADRIATWEAWETVSNDAQ